MVSNARQTSGGVWYYVVTIATAGLLACVPFFHAATVLGRRRLWVTGAAYAAAAAVGGVVLDTAPVDETGAATGWMSNVAGMLMLAVIVAAVLQQRPLRQEVYGPTGRYARESAKRPDPAVAAVSLARAKRAAARALAERDPLMARELRVGRPDLPRQYDDGGLVDLNDAPAEVIADGCRVPLAMARAVVAARERLGRFTSVDEVLVYADVDAASAECVRDKGIVLVVRA